MKKIFCFCAFFVCFFVLSPNVFANDDTVTLPSYLRPLTNEEIVTFQDRSFKDKIRFLSSYYVENKLAYNATDEAILNEMIKLDPQTALTVIKASQNIEKGMATFKEYYREIVADINVLIAERHPDKPDYLIDPNDYSTLANLSHVTEIGGISFDLVDSWTDKRSFSESERFDFGRVRLYSCARQKNEDILMGLSLFLAPDYSLLYQKEGEYPSLIEADYSRSENLKASELFYPVKKTFKINNTTFSGYEGDILLPFTLKVIDDKKSAAVHASYSFTICKKDDCKKVTTPLMSQDFPRNSVVDTKICYEIQNQKRKIPQFDKINVDIKKTVLEKTEEGVFLFVLVSDSVLNFDRPVLKIENTAGLHFSKSFFNMKDGQILFRSRLLNPEQLKFPLNLELTLQMTDRGKIQNVTIEKIEEKDALFKVNVVTYFKTFFFGLKFFFFTPLLTILTLLVYQMFIVKTPSEEKTKEFSIGLLISFVVSVFLAFLFVEIGLFAWGKQFSIPYLNCLFMIIFFSSPFMYFFLLNKAQAFDQKEKDKNVEKFIYRYPMMCCGLTIGFMSSALLLITPQFATFFEAYTLIKTQGFTGSFIFLLSLTLPCILVYVFRKKIQPKYVNLSTRGVVLFCVSNIAQGVLFLPVIGIQSGFVNFMLLLFCTAFAAALFINNHLSARFKPFIFIAIMPVFLVFIPFSAKKLPYETFSQEKIQKALNERKTVYLNVYNSACLICYYNLWEFSITSRQFDAKKEKILILTGTLEEESIKKLLTDAEAYAIPMNLLFSDKYPEGYFLPQSLSREKVLIGLKQVLEKD